MKRVLLDLRPPPSWLPPLLLPDDDLAVVGGGREDRPVLGVRPGDGPDRAFVAS